MASFFRAFTKKIFVLVTVLVSALFLIACSAWWLEPGQRWWVGILGVGFAFLFFAALALLVFWITVRSRWFMLPLLVLLLGWRPLNAFFALHPFAHRQAEKMEGSIRVMQWNVARFDEMNHLPGSPRSKRKQLLDYIRQQNPDIICMQEFLETRTGKLLQPNIRYFRDTLGFKYYAYAMDHRQRDSLYEHGIAIFSKFPIVNTVRYKFGGPKTFKADESYAYADVVIKGQTIRVMTTHLQSLLLGKKELESVEEMKAKKEVDLDQSKGIFKKFRQAYVFRQQQADKIRASLDTSRYPVIFCADFNDVPNSYVYHHILGDRQDAWTSKGFGIGRTFSYISPTLRIDYIFADPRFTVGQVHTPHPALSDHYPVIADLFLPGEK
ncbi:MAG: endonuclease/exonuclease/phosphatase family protein [Bacteroidetes bacterium]|nr:endonuclease/exonuclease/phosphatase family protein [Bacteroidota bacterium]